MRAAAIALALVLGACGGGGGTNEISAPRQVPDPVDSPAGCEAAVKMPIEGTSHIPPTKRATYRTNPPTSGEHYSAAGVGPAPPGVYTEAPVDGGLVHNLEHGHVIFWHTTDVSKTLVDSLGAVVDKDPRFRLLMPRDAMPYKIAFTAWGVIQGCAAPTAEVAKAAEQFTKRFQQRAPENIPGKPLA